MKTLIGLAVVLLANVCFATTWYVNGTTGSDENSGECPVFAKATIQAAINASASGDTVLVAAGTYAPIDAHGKCIAIKSEKGFLSTIIDGGGNCRCAQLINDPSLDWEDRIDEAATIDGFTLQHGYAEGDAGVEGGTVRNCLITQNYGWDDAGGGGHARFYNCLIVANRTSNYGGGPSGSGVRCCVAVNCTISHNISEGGGGAVSHKSRLMNCIIAENYDGNGELDNIHDLGSDVDVKLLLNCYTATPGFANAENGDYRLVADSPCIDAGDNSHVVGDIDFDGLNRIANGTVDIGCYEYGSYGGPFVEKVFDVDWTYMIMSGVASVGDGVSAAVSNGVVGSVGVPTKLRERPVVAIDGKAFVDCTNMTSVTIPASVKTIGDSAFEGCGSLADVYFEGNTLSAIGKNAFSGCYWDLIMHVPADWQGRGRTLCGYSVWKAGSSDEENLNP